MADKSNSVNARIEKARRKRSTTLDLSGLELFELPDAIGHLTHLQKLDISKNQLRALPDSIGRLTQLQSLTISQNELRVLPDSISRLTQIRSLNISKNQFSVLPDFIGRLTQLRSLFCQDNQLSALPDFIGRLTQLQKLDISRNKLSVLPDFIGRLPQLQFFAAYDNQLSALPESIGCLTQLQFLDLSNNQLLTLPASLSKLGTQVYISLHGNEQLNLPAEVLGPKRGDIQYNSFKTQMANPSNIVDYYFKVLKGHRPLNEAKLILVGRGEVGKTSIVNYLVNKRFSEGEKKTEGIKIIKWSLLLKGFEDIRLNIWDFGGQEIMHATHQFFLTQRSLYLLVLSGREGGEEADADYWLKLIESFGADSPVIVVLNKIKEHPFDVNRRALQKKYHSIRDFIKTDCEDGTGIENLQKAIEREIDRMDHLRDPFPASWFTIKDKLAGMRENYLSFDEYRKVCAELNENDPCEQEKLAGYLHSLGIALNYKDDPRLLDMHVLNPHWVTNGIYKILNSGILEAQKGEIRLGELTDLLDGAAYPFAMRRFLLDLMKRFDLCFSFPSNDAHYLIPELLDKQEPKETEAFIPVECLNFQYDYTILPEGLLPRFIVRTHGLSDGLRRWRTGVILKFEGNCALVKADMQEKKVYISISGSVSGRRRLLAVIRTDFERIHHDIHNLKPLEMVPLPDSPEVAVAYEKLLVMEEEGIKEFPEYAQGKVIKLNVQELLNGVDLGGSRRREGLMDTKKQPVRLFYSYSHKDESLRNELETHLKILQREGFIETWSDRNIEAGNEWKQQIDENLERADIILLLVSSDFVASDYCYEKEMNRAMERHEKKEARVVPIIVRDVNWRIAPFAKFKALPKDGLAVNKWSHRDSAWRNVAEGIQKIVETMVTSKKRL